MNDKYKTLKSECKFKGEVIELNVDLIEMPHGEIAKREYVRHKGAVAVVAVTSERKIVLVNQYRHPTGDFLLEIPAGKLDEGEDSSDCAVRELEEETGYLCGSLTKLATLYTTPGYSDELLHLYLAQDLRQGKIKREEGEEMHLEVLEVSLDEVLQMITQGKIKDGKTICGICLAQTLSYI